MRTLEGGCSVPIGVETVWNDTMLMLKASVTSIDGTKAVNAEQLNEVTCLRDADELGQTAAGNLRSKGANDILGEIQVVRMRAPAVQGEPGTVGKLETRVDLVPT